MAIGLIGKDFNVNNKIPGWETNSIGYHSDDGNIFVSKTQGDPYGPTFNSGDFVGCCVDFINKIVFFTKNGEILKNVIFEVNYELFPAVGMRKNNQSIVANFGCRNFVFDFKKYYNKIFDELIEEILKTNLDIIKSSKFNNSISSNHQIILDYLIYNGHQDTLNEIINNEDKPYAYPFFDNFQNIKLRKEIFRLIKQKNLSTCLEIVKNNFPNCEFILCFLEILIKIENCVKYYLNVLSESAFIDLIKILKIEILNSHEYKFILNHRISYSYSYNLGYIFLQNIIDKIISSCSHDLNSSCSFLTKVITGFYSEQIFDIINKNILEKEYGVYSNEFQSIYTQTLVTIKENLNIKNPVVNFLFSNKFFLEKINKKFNEKLIDFSDLSMNKENFNIKKENFNDLINK